MREIETINLSLDEFEALRLCDLEQLDQTEAGKQMDISRGTVQRLLYAGRQKIIQALLEEQTLTVNLIQVEVDHANVHSHPKRRSHRRKSI